MKSEIKLRLGRGKRVHKENVADHAQNAVKANKSVFKVIVNDLPTRENLILLRQKKGSAEVEPEFQVGCLG